MPYHQINVARDGEERERERDKDIELERDREKAIRYKQNEHERLKWVIKWLEQKLQDTEV